MSLLWRALNIGFFWLRLRASLRRPVRAAGTAIRCSRDARVSLVGTCGADKGTLLGGIGACVLKYALTGVDSGAGCIGMLAASGV